MWMTTGEFKNDRETAAMRLRKAVDIAGVGNPTQTAKRFGWAVPTFLSHCNGTRSFDVATGKKYASRLKVHAQWLILGIGEPRGGAGIDDRLITSGLPEEVIADLTQQFGFSIESHKKRKP